VFQQATGRLPLRDQVELVERTLRENNLINAAYLQVYWEEWVRRDKKRSDLTWLNWAVQGRIPDTHAPGSALEEMLHNLAVVAQQGADDGQP
jgi:hypothetical protein